MPLANHPNLLGRQLTAAAAGIGNVDGPASSTDNAIVRFDGTTGKLIQNSVLIVADTTGALSGFGAGAGITFSGGGNIVGTSGSLALAASGTNQNITLTPSGTASLVVATTASNGGIMLSGTANVSGLTSTASAGQGFMFETAVNNNRPFVQGFSNVDLRSYDGTGYVVSLRIVGNGTVAGAGTWQGGPQNLIIQSGTGNSRTMALQTTTSGGVATTFLSADDAQNATFASNIIVGAGKDVRLDSSNRLYFSSGHLIALSAGFNFDFGNGILGFGGATSSFPALKRSSTTLAVRLADDSADAPITASNITLSGTYVGSTQALSGAGAANVTTETTKITTTGVGDAITLADGVDGQTKIIIHDVDGGSFVLTPTTKTGWSTFTSTAAGESITLKFVTTRGWIVIGNYLGVIAP